MQCPRCNVLIEPNASSCRNCGLQLTTSNPPGATQAPAYAPASGLENRSLAASAPVAEQPVRRRRSSRRFLGGCLITLLILALLLVGVWFVAVRPYLNGLAKDQINQVLDSGVQQINPEQAVLLPSGVFPITETTLNNFVTLNHAPSSPLQNTQVIVDTALHLNFTLYGFQCSIVGTPVVNAGQLQLANVHTTGIISLILSDDDLTQIADAHLATAQQRLKHPIISATLQNHEIDLSVGPPTAVLTRSRIWA